MVANMVVFDRESPDRIACFQLRQMLNSAIGPLQKGVGGENFKNLRDTWVPSGVLGRYYFYSKPGGPLSQDTHTSSGLSIYGLGDGA